MSSKSIQPVATEAIVVSFLLTKAKEIGRWGLTPLQVNKLAFILHGWTLGLLERPLFDNSPKRIQAWRYGPVVVGIYRTLKPFGNNLVTIDHIKTRYQYGKDDPSKYEDVISVDIEEFMQKDKDATGHLDWVYDIYSDLDGGQLISYTHRRGGPWDQCRARGFEVLGLRGERHIPDDVIHTYYKEYIKNNLNS